MKWLKHLSIYTLVGFAGASVSFFLLPYLSHFLTPADYGILSLINALVTILIPCVSLMAFSWLNVVYFKEPYKDDFAAAFSSVQIVPLVPLVVLTILTYAFQEPLAQWLEIPHDKSYWITLAVALAVLTVYYETLLNFTITTQASGMYSAYNLGKLAVEMSLTVLFITCFDMNWEGRLLAWMISLILSAIVFGVYFYGKGLLTLSFNKTYFRTSIAFGVPLILHTIGKFIINQSDRIFIAKMISVDEAGLYSVGYQIGMVVLIFVTAAGNFFQPYLFERLTRRDETSAREIVRMTYLLLALSCVVLILLTIGSPFLFEWFLHASYANAVHYVFWVGLGYLFWGTYLFASGYIFFSGKTTFLSYMALVNIGLNLILNYFLILRWGALGAAYATCISFAVVALLTGLQAQKLYPMPWLNAGWLKK